MRDTQYSRGAHAVAAGGAGDLSVGVAIARVVARVAARHHIRHLGPGVEAGVVVLLGTRVESGLGLVRLDGGGHLVASVVARVVAGVVVDGVAGHVVVHVAVVAGAAASEHPGQGPAQPGVTHGGGRDRGRVLGAGARGGGGREVRGHHGALDLGHP